MPLGTLKDQINALNTGAQRLDGGAARLYDGAAAVSPSTMVDSSHTAAALGVVGTLGAGSLGAFALLPRTSRSAG